MGSKHFLGAHVDQDSPLMVKATFELEATTVTIADGESLSDIADLSQMGTPVALITDANWDGPNSISFVDSHDGVLWSELHDMGVAVMVPGTVAGVKEALDPLQFLSSAYLRVRSGTSDSPVPQSGATTVTILTRRF